MIQINNLIKNIGIRKLFEIDKLVINKTDKIGLLGDNGTGKTTFFKNLIGLDREYLGKIEIDMEMDYLLNEDIQNKYSPGEYQKLKLEKLLSDKSKFLLIDEPTSHLDIEEKEKLIGELESRKIGFIIISHERDFINRICNKIYEISNGKIEVYNGNYEFYLEEKIRRSKFIEREYENYINEKQRLENLAKDIKKESSKIRTTPKRMGNSEARLHKMGGQENKKKLDKRVKSVESRISQLEIKEKPKEETIIELNMPDSDKIHSKILVKAKNLNKKFGDKIIFENANFNINNIDKIALLGNNGIGKTTLLKMILERENIWVHPNLKIGYYSQMGEIIDNLKTVLENVFETSIYDQSMTRIILARLGFKNENVLKSVGVLSDGERAKVKLAKLLTSNFNYLILDEPTNYLDISSIEVLEELLNSYDRGFIFVTHDIAFINNIANKLLIIENKKIINFDGNLKEYRESMKSSKELNNDKIILDFKLSAINARLTMDISKEEREKLEEEYKEIIKNSHGLFH